jgi:hypothetical protein
MDNSGDYVSLNIDISRVGTLYLLLDSGADSYILTSKKLIGICEFETRNRVKIKSVDRSTIETHWRMDGNIKERSV